MRSMGSPSADLEAKDETPDLGKPKPFMKLQITQAGLAFAITPPYIVSASLNSTPRSLTWVFAAYSLTIGTLKLVSGSLGDIYDHRLSFTMGFMWAGVWSILVGFSVWYNPVFFDCCRVFQGIGPALLLPIAVAILGRSCPPGRWKRLISCLFGAEAPGGFTLGATFFSLTAERLWWPWAYWIMGIACVIFAVLGLLVIPYERSRALTSRHMKNWTYEMPPQELEG